MFDWNDEEITNILWGEGQESDDHTVPYPDGREEKPSGLYGDETGKEWNDGAEDVKRVEQRSPVSRSELNGAKLETDSQCDKNGSCAKGLKTESWPDISLSSIAKPNQDLMGTEASKKKVEISKPGSSIQAGETAQLSDCSEIFSSGDKDQNDFVDYDWASIGSFDDLDRIFSNDGPISGRASVINEDELWPSFEDVTRSPEKCLPLSFEGPSISIGAPRSASNQFETTSEYIFHQDHPSASGYGYTNKNATRTTQDQHVCMETMGYTGGEVKPLHMETTFLEVSGKISAFNSQNSAETLAKPDDSMDKGKRQKEVKSEGKMEVREQQDICSSWSTSGNQLQKFGSQYAPTMRHFCSPLLTHQLNFGEGNSQTVTFGNEVSPSSSFPQNKRLDATIRTPPMTPREKIEKLRRRQQMRAMLAIQKQQQQFDNKVSASEHPVVELANKQAKNLNILSTLDPTSSVEQDDDNCISNDDRSVEHSVLNRLQTIIGKMDLRMRLCIRDSLFRLAQSTIQRKYASDTSSANRGSMDEVFNEDGSYTQNRFSGMADAETETNPIDRTVAHLLFHRPLFSAGINCEMPESPSSSNLHNSMKEAGLESLAGTFMPPENNQTLSHDESTVPLLFLDGDQSKGGLRVDTSENASNNVVADNAVTGFKAPY